jgi:hypothetical protein
VIIRLKFLRECEIEEVAHAAIQITGETTAGIPVVPGARVFTRQKTTRLDPICVVVRTLHH